MSISYSYTLLSLQDVESIVKEYNDQWGAHVVEVKWRCKEENILEAQVWVNELSK